MFVDVLMVSVRFFILVVAIRMNNWHCAGAYYYAFRRARSDLQPEKYSMSDDKVFDNCPHPTACVVNATLPVLPR